MTYLSVPHQRPAFPSGSILCHHLLKELPPAILPSLSSTINFWLLLHPSFPSETNIMLILASWKPHKNQSWPHFSPLYHPRGEEKLEKRNLPLEKRNYLLSSVSLLPVFLELFLIRLSSQALVWNSSLSCYHDLLVAKPNGPFLVLILLDLLGASETQGSHPSLHVVSP